MLLAAWLELRAAAAEAGDQKPAPHDAAQNPPNLADLAAGKLAIVDLGWPLNRDSAIFCFSSARRAAWGSTR